MTISDGLKHLEHEKIFASVAEVVVSLFDFRELPPVTHWVVKETALTVLFPRYARRLVTGHQVQSKPHPVHTKCCGSIHSPSQSSVGHVSGV